VFAHAGFDAVVGNPPFGAVVDGRVPAAIKSQRATRFQELTGTADLSYYFASLALRLVHPKGRAAMILPRAFLGARSSEGLRNLDGHEFSVLASCSQHDAFDGASVYVCLAGFESRSLAPIVRDMAQQEPVTLNVTASLTVAEAYNLAQKLIDRKVGAGYKLLTTGLIDREKSLWGDVPCRYLKKKYAHPRAPARSLSATRNAMARKPKIIVAGLSRVIECFLDETAEYAGSVGTYTITHPTDDRRMLRRAMQRLHSKEISTRFRQELGSAALGGGNITLTKRFLRQVLAEAGF
jgi:hypothetical protein